jgi:hypothetical protein
MIRCSSLAEACGAGRLGTVQFLVDLDETDLDACGPDGISPLCIAATWGYADIVQLLVDAACDPNVRNADPTSSTALHAAACQEHGPIIHALLSAGANGALEDADGRTACDFASVSDGLWPLFAARGYTRTPKDVLVAKRVIHKVDPAVSDVADATEGISSSGGGSGGGARASTLPFYSRPGSAYVRSDAAGPSGAASSSAQPPLAQIPEHGIDPLEHLGVDDDDDPDDRGPRSRVLGALYREGF